MVADVTGNAAEVPEGSQRGAKGAALCAAIAIGHFESVAQACTDTYRLDRVHHPAQMNSEHYEAGYARYKTWARSALTYP